MFLLWSQECNYTVILLNAAAISFSFLVGGKFSFVSQENFEEYLTAAGRYLPNAERS